VLTQGGKELELFEEDTGMCCIRELCVLYCVYLTSASFYFELLFTRPSFLELLIPLRSNRHFLSNDDSDCLEGKRENYQVSSVQYCVQQLCTVQCTHMNSCVLLVRLSFFAVILCVAVYQC